MSSNDEVLGTFYGDESFPITWEEGEQELFWIYDDLHIPNPVSPMFFDIGGWWLTCDHMFRRFGTPFACDWIAKNINGYVYTAAVPADSSLHAEATEYQARYVPRVPRDPDYPQKIGAYMNAVLPHYAHNFLDWWQTRLRPEMERNFAYLDNYDTEHASLVELAVLLEDAIDIHDRHWKIHWMLNFAQFSSTLNLNALIQEIKGAVDPNLMGRLQSSLADRNWDSIEALWRIKEEIKADDDLRQLFKRGETAADIWRALQQSSRGQQLIRERIEPYQQEFGYKSIWSHEFAFPTWKEQATPIIEILRGYLETDYDYPRTIQGVREDLDRAIHELMDDVPPGEGRERLQQALDLSLRMNPLTPDHHFYIDQGTNARLRLVLIAIGKKLVQARLLDDPEDVMYLRYNELRLLMTNPGAVPARELVSQRRDERERAYQIRPREWVGTATKTALAFPYNALWGFPEKFYKQPAQKSDEIRGLAASPGVVEGPARVVLSLEQFDQVREGDILVCRMTNPAWVVLFTRIVGLVTDAGGVTSHPAVVSREFGIPAVVGTSDATQRIKTGDRIRVNGATGVVEVLA
ncbi:MAG: PEP-utilizing protein [Thermogemmatispora sp.]|uniref:PEP-utilizing protein n=2 Tax=Thermogemmatispora TaxID=768669 RepID=A0A328VPA5_9CHLR|nr:PEP-utilizing enzyme [Thermogemmatispora tikiterensis]MBX5457704.1 PEP-utilizing protein [Thermogemmatispora sp.]RAQ97610.1 PEP-utilizing protein [Thermogemmatispora tikiterensis]